MDSAKRCGAREITLLIGYLGYARQDHRSHDGDCLGAYVMAKMISSCRPDRLIVVDVHRPQLEGFFDIPMINIDPTPIVFPLFKKLSLPIVVAVDHGAFEKGRKLCKALGCALVMVDKRRNVDGHCISHQLMGDVAGRDCILVDDILDTGATFCQASALVFNAKARSIRGWVTHCIISKDGWEQLNQWPITELFTSDSTVHEPIKTHEPMKGVIKTISIVALLVERLQRFRV
jgi:ribose-phosphate pyrophosphokinase